MRISDWSADVCSSDLFALSPYLRLVDEFCRESLPGIASKRVGSGIDETFFHVYFKCEQCHFLEHCSEAIAPERGPERRDVSAVSGLTYEAKRSLGRLGVHTVAELSRAPGLAQAPGVGWSHRRRAPHMLARARAAASNAPPPMAVKNQSSGTTTIEV